ncbi:hypothetical protein OAI26_02300 [Sulfitobacter sp.]|nr:hypothetical protein [Sulfitobacter sp.]
MTATPLSETYTLVPRWSTIGFAHRGPPLSMDCRQINFRHHNLAECTLPGLAE